MQQTFDVACLFVGACSTYRRGRSGFRPFAVALECASPALMSLEFLPYHRGPGRALPRFFAMRDENFKMPVDTSVTAFYMPVRRPDGGIGRRASFRCWYSKGCGGSSPLLGTIPFSGTAFAVRKSKKARVSGLFCFQSFEANSAGPPFAAASAFPQAAVPASVVFTARTTPTTS